jgi:hypothetical protein
LEGVCEHDVGREVPRDCHHLVAVAEFDWKVQLNQADNACRYEQAERNVIDTLAGFPQLSGSTPIYGAAQDLQSAGQVLSY